MIINLTSCHLGRAWMLTQSVTLTSCDPGDAQTVWPLLEAVLRGSSPTASYTARRPQPPTPSWSVQPGNPTAAAEKASTPQPCPPPHPGRWQRPIPGDASR